MSTDEEQKAVLRRQFREHIKEEYGIDDVSAEEIEELVESYHEEHGNYQFDPDDDYDVDELEDVMREDIEETAEEVAPQLPMDIHSLVMRAIGYAVASVA